jgi:D-psicose/D-tagatose/L-ribulose 3-epimerase
MKMSVIEREGAASPRRGPGREVMMSPRLAISNIAWPSGADEEVFAVLGRHGVTDIEVAPTKLWPRPAEVPMAAVRRWRDDLEGRGLRVAAAQALLFGRPDLTIFEDAPTRRSTLEYLDAIVRLCAELGAEALVFGSPKNRRVGDLAPDRAARIAEDFFGALADIAGQHGTVVVLEANPAEYQADFLTRAAEAAALVRRVDRPGLRLHLDTACMTMAGDDVEGIFREHAGLVHHFHISEPWLGPVGVAPAVDHARFAACLRRCGYARRVSIEMRAPEPFSAGALDDAIAWCRKVYLGAG